MQETELPTAIGDMARTQPGFAAGQGPGGADEGAAAPRLALPLDDQLRPESARWRCGDLADEGIRIDADDRLRLGSVAALGLTGIEEQPARPARNLFPDAAADGYDDQLDSIDENGCVDVPEGPGLGVTLNWDYIEKNTIDKVVYE